MDGKSLAFATEFAGLFAELHGVFVHLFEIGANAFGETIGVGEGVVFLRGGVGEFPREVGRFAVEAIALQTQPVHGASRIRRVYHGVRITPGESFS